MKKLTKQARQYYLSTRYSFTKTRKAFSMFKQEIARSENEVKGIIFEDYLRKTLFPISDYSLIHRTPSYNKVDCEDNIKLPDFWFESKKNKEYKIAIEAKFISKKSDWIKVCSQTQIERYKQFERFENMKVFIAIGLGGSPYSPTELFLPPIKSLNTSNGFHKYDYLNRFPIHHEKVTLEELSQFLNPTNLDNLKSTRPSYT